MCQDLVAPGAKATTSAFAVKRIPESSALGKRDSDKVNCSSVRDISRNSIISRGRKYGPDISIWLYNTAKAQTLWTENARGERITNHKTNVPRRIVPCLFKLIGSLEFCFYQNNRQGQYLMSLINPQASTYCLSLILVRTWSPLVVYAC